MFIRQSFRILSVRSIVSAASVLSILLAPRLPAAGATLSNGLPEALQGRATAERPVSHASANHRSIRKQMTAATLETLSALNAADAVTSMDIPKQTASIIFQLQAQYDAAPRVEAFDLAIWADPCLPCTVKNAIQRIERVATSPSMRRLVWRRMLSQELYWATRAQINRVEVLASNMDMPLN